MARVCPSTSSGTLRHSRHVGFGKPHAMRNAWLGAQEREDREHPAVVVGRGRQAELREDARHVLLHGAKGDEEALGDRLVRAALGHQLEYLPLARGELLERVVTALAANELADDGGIERGAAVGDPAHGRAELLEVRDPVLEEIADALGARLEQRHRIARLDVLRKEQDADTGMPLTDLT